MNDLSLIENRVIDGFPVPAYIRRAMAVQVKILSIVDKVCKKYNISYFAESGTLLGAVRHGGFIPWDDDLDIVMLRPDYMRFFSVIKAELPEGYKVISIYDDEEYDNYLIRIVNSQGINGSASFLEDNFGCPYSIGIDVFVYDYISDDEKVLSKQRNDYIRLNKYVRQAKEDLLAENEAIGLINELASQYGYDIDNSKSVKNRLYMLQDAILAYCPEKNASRIGLSPFWIEYDGCICDKSYYDKQVYTAFENVQIPVTPYYDEILTKRYGEFMRIDRSGGLHNYPFFKSQIELKEANWGKSRFQFEWNDQYLDIIEGRQAQASLKECANERIKEYSPYIKVLEDAYENLYQLLEAGSSELALKVLEKCQEIGINLGTLIESIYGENGSDAIPKVIKSIEQYCEAVYGLYEAICAENMDSISIKYSELASATNNVIIAIQNNIIDRRTVVFLVYKGAYFESYKDLYIEEKGQSGTDTYVVLMSYGYRSLNPNDTNKEMIYDEEGISEEVKYVKEGKINIEKMHPDIIYMQYQYDDYNSVTCVNSEYHSNRLTKYTDRLIYVPYEKIGSIKKDDTRGKLGLVHFLPKPVIIYADEIVVRTKELKELYKDVIREWSGIDSIDDILDRKIIVREDTKESRDKKTVLYYVSCSKLISNEDKAIAKIRKSLDTFVDNSDKIDVKWIVDRGMLDILKEVNINLYGRFSEVLDEYKDKDNILIVNSCDYDRAADESVAIYGDPGIIATKMIARNKPVMIANYDII